jgi:uncharacterized membrane protein YraQ (UPF0718 family)
MAYLTSITAGFWHTLEAMAPYLLFGFLAAGLLSVFVSPELVERHLGRGRGRPVVKAALFGVPLPLCSCSVIPVATSLRRHGANRGATVSFLISAPQTGVDSIFVTYSLLGPVFAVFRPLAAFVSGLFGGLIVAHADGEGETPPGEEDAPTCCCCHAPGARRSLRAGLRHGFVTLPRDIANSLIVGLLLAGLIGALIPEAYFAGGLGSGWGAKFLMMLAGIPVYVCATATVPVAAALIGAGLSPGAALVFLMTGPATNAATIATVWNVMGKRTAWLYVAVVGVSALAAGGLLDKVYQSTGATAAVAEHAMLPGAVRTAAAVALLLLLAAAKWPGKQEKKNHG